MSPCAKCGGDGPRRKYRKTCYACEKEARRARHHAAKEPDFEITVDPLAQAYAEASAAKERRDIRREHAALVEENTRLKSELAAMLEARRPPNVVIYDKAPGARADAVAIAILSDWHVEEQVRKEDVHGLNEYNLEVAKKRAEHCFRNLLRLTEIAARDSAVHTIHLSILGDLFSGWIHEELIANTLLSPPRASHFVQNILCSGIDFLLRESSFNITADCIPGNHGRLTHKMHIGDPTGTSLETFMYHGVAARYADNPRVRIDVADRAFVYRRFFEKFVLRQLHGYEVKFGGGIGGLTIPLNKKIAKWDTSVPATLTALGHFHQRFDGGNFLANGSLIGWNTYAQTIGASFEEPCQAFALIHARHGGQKSLVAPIWLEDV